MGRRRRRARGAHRGRPHLDDQLGEIDRRSGGELRALRDFGELSGKLFSTTLAAGGGVRSTRILTVGVGPAGDVTREAVVRTAATAIRRLGGRTVHSLAYWLDELPAIAGGVASIAELVTRGIVEGSFEPATIYRETVESPPPALDELIVVAAPRTPRALAPRRSAAGSSARGQPHAAARAARRQRRQPRGPRGRGARRSPRAHGLELTCSGPTRPARWAWACSCRSGAAPPTRPGSSPCAPAPRARRTPAGRLLAMVGKGVTLRFRRHQHQARRPDGRHEDGQDRCLHRHRGHRHRGAAGPRDAAAGGRAGRGEHARAAFATRPGDVVRALNGKTVEVTNTDAEGRLILGDAMTWAERQGATHLVDVATLTGAVERALGQARHRRLRHAAVVLGRGAGRGRRRAGERYWQLPFVDEYRADMESGTRTSSTPGPPTARSSRARCSCGSSSPGRGSTWTSRAPRTAQGDAVGRARRHGRLARDARGAGARGRRHRGPAPERRRPRSVRRRDPLRPGRARLGVRGGPDRGALAGGTTTAPSARSTGGRP